MRRSRARSIELLASREDLPLLCPDGAVVAELGVAEGDLSAKFLQHTNVERLYLVDRWAGDRRHDDAQADRVLRRFAAFGGRVEILRTTFAQAATLFPDLHFDLVYVDGYAHEGEEGGQTYADWWPKVRRGGIFAGHDYDPERWPEVVKWVDHYADLWGVRVVVFDPPRRRAGPNSGEHPSWATRKP